MFQSDRASFFWKRYFYVFFPLFIFGVSHESYLIDNSLASLEDIGEFVFFFCLYLFNFAVLAALLTNLWWFFLPTKPAHSETDFW